MPRADSGPGPRKRSKLVQPLREAKADFALDSSDKGICKETLVKSSVIIK